MDIQEKIYKYLADRTRLLESPEAVKRNEVIVEWLDKQKHLPHFLNDFHRAKEFFKLMHWVQRDAGTTMPGREEISWMEGQIYVIDKFLWFCAKFGYTLQRSRKGLEFRDLDEFKKLAEDFDTIAFLQEMERRRNEKSE